eukprot:757253-Hanusia_phi.AAC.1
MEDPSIGSKFCTIDQYQTGVQLRLASTQLHRKMASLTDLLLSSAHAALPRMLMNGKQGAG